MTLSKISLIRLATAHPSLVALVEEVSKSHDIIVVSGHRTREEQEDCVRRKTSRLHFPNSPHNRVPSMGVDLAPAVGKQIDWNDIESFKTLGAIVLKTAEKLGLHITWGGNFTHADLPHYELTGWKNG